MIKVWEVQTRSRSIIICNGCYLTSNVTFTFPLSGLGPSVVAATLPHIQVWFSVDVALVTDHGGPGVVGPVSLIHLPMRRVRQLRAQHSWYFNCDFYCDILQPILTRRFWHNLG